MENAIERLEDLILILNNENGALSEVTREELLAEKEHLELKLKAEKVRQLMGY